MNRNQLQQGDVTIERIDSIPTQAKKLPHKTLREGEHTGHAHVATAEDARLFLVGEKLYLSAPSGTEIVHEEHHAFTVPPGDYVVGAVQEYDHFLEESREVMD